MEKAMVVFCDIVGTYGKPYESEERENQIKHFICLLENIRRLNNDEKIYFSFISFDCASEIKCCLEEIRKYDICGNLCYDKSFYSGGHIEVRNNDFIIYENQTSLNKATTIIDYSKELGKEYEIDKIFYFDDTDYNHMFFMDLCELHDCNFDIVSVIPTSLENLNDWLEGYIHTNYGNLEKVKKIKEAVF